MGMTTIYYIDPFRNVIACVDSGLFQDFISVPLFF